MDRRWIVVLAAPGLMATACRTTPVDPLTTSPVAAVIVSDLNDPAWPSDPITLDSAVVTPEGRASEVSSWTSVAGASRMRSPEVEPHVDGVVVLPVSFQLA